MHIEFAVGTDSNSGIEAVFFIKCINYKNPYCKYFVNFKAKFYTLMSVRKSLYACFLFLFALTSCTKKKELPPYEKRSGASLHTWNKRLTDVIVQDVFKPPLAARIYANCNLAAMEVLALASGEINSVAPVLKNLKSLPKPDPALAIDYEIAANMAFSTVAKKMVYSENMVAEFEKQYADSVMKSGIDEDIVKHSIQFGRQAGDSMLKWIGRDGFLESRKITRYALSDSAGAWKLTPPDYMPACEPYWDTIRTFFIGHPREYVPDVFPVYSMEKNASFYNQVIEVYEEVNSQDPEQRNIAIFWDDNPNVSHHEGHLTLFAQKMTPGGHWIAIARKALMQTNSNLVHSAMVYAVTAMSISDAFVVCWHWKYICNFIRPVTVINEHIDPKWDPILQTPPFPEFPSGHSSVSGAAAEVLTGYFGDNFAFTDSSEVEYGLPVRTFTSFREAANEASVSRIYGGIHFRDAIEQGIILGRMVGKQALQSTLQAGNKSFATK